MSLVDKKGNQQKLFPNGILSAEAREVQVARASQALHEYGSELLRKLREPSGSEKKLKKKKK